jgi:hypothetical protein
MHVTREPRTHVASNRCTTAPLHPAAGTPCTGCTHSVAPAQSLAPAQPKHHSPPGPSCTPAGPGHPEQAGVGGSTQHDGASAVHAHHRGPGGEVAASLRQLPAACVVCTCVCGLSTSCWTNRLLPTCGPAGSNLPSRPADPLPRPGLARRWSCRERHHAPALTGCRRSWPRPLQHCSSDIGVQPEHVVRTVTCAVLLRSAVLPR